MRRRKEAGMLPIKSIVAPTDFSEEAKNGLRAATDLAKHFSATLHLLHVVNPVPIIPGAAAPTGFHITSVMNELLQMARSSMDDLIEKDLPAGVTVNRQILSGDPALEIVRFSEGNDADMIVMATHGQSGWRRFVSGSVTEKVVRHASLPVLTVRNREVDGGGAVGNAPD
jgi:nucleotide-binding universal stress UspA family protein